MNFTVENIVNKYINFVKNTPVEGEYIVKGNGELGPIMHDEYDAPTQLTNKLYLLKRGEAADKEIVKWLQVTKGSFAKNALTKEELDFLLCNYTESIDYLSTCNVHMKWQEKDAANWNDIFENVEKNINFVPGSKVYVSPFDITGELAIKHPDCHFS